MYSFIIIISSSSSSSIFTDNVVSPLLWLDCSTRHFQDSKRQNLGFFDLTSKDLE